MALSIITALLTAFPSSSFADEGQDGSILLPSNVLSGLESGIFKYTNAHRVDGGAPAFAESSSADEMARAFSLTLVKSRLFSEDQPGLPFAQRLQQAAPCGDSCADAAENVFQIDYPSIQALLADVQSTDQIDKMAKDIVDGWLASPGHRRNIEDPLLEALGVGVAVSLDGKLYATQDFIRTTPLTGQQYLQDAHPDQRRD